MDKIIVGYRKGGLVWFHGHNASVIYDKCFGLVPWVMAFHCPNANMGIDGHEMDLVLKRLEESGYEVSIK